MGIARLIYFGRRTLCSDLASGSGLDLIRREQCMLKYFIDDY